MAKYDLEFKMKVVNEYINGPGGYKTVGERHGIGHAMVRKWYLAHCASSMEGLERKKTRTKYSLEDKIAILRWMRENDASLTINSAKFRINNPSLIAAWRIAFRRHGIDGLTEKRKGRPSMKKPKKVDKRKTDYVKNLEHENELLRAELAYIKKLKASGINIPSRLLKSNHGSLRNSEKNSD
ncbi:transposase [Macrococcus bovicus]|uniref:transposase n=1 Tax=Macrococcus bovicus TaxID=69968 RepID=UPI0025A549A5|nr:transposase [Macrococcus bovicus]WJP98074.1 transposase [Macrococcus bovicus]